MKVLAGVIVALKGDGLAEPVLRRLVGSAEHGTHTRSFERWVIANDVESSVGTIGDRPALLVLGTTWDKALALAQSAQSFSPIVAVFSVAGYTTQVRHGRRPLFDSSPSRVPETEFGSNVSWVQLRDTGSNGTVRALNLLAAGFEPRKKSAERRSSSARLQPVPAGVNADDPGVLGKGYAGR